MELTYFLAKLIGLTLMIFAVAGLMRPELIEKGMADLKENTFVSIMAGFIAIVAGLAIVLGHNVWVANWPVLITIIGWGALLKGVTYLTAKPLLLSTGQFFMGNKNKLTIVLVVAFLVGGLLTYKGLGF